MAIVFKVDRDGNLYRADKEDVEPVNKPLTSKQTKSREINPRGTTNVSRTSGSYTQQKRTIDNIAETSQNTRQYKKSNPKRYSNSSRNSFLKNLAYTILLVGSVTIGGLLLKSASDNGSESETDTKPKIEMSAKVKQNKELQTKIVEEKNSLEKKVFMYTQDLDVKAVKNGSIDVCDYLLPHIYTIDAKITKSKKGVVNVGTPFMKSRASKTSIENYISNATKEGMAVIPMIGSFKPEVIKKILDNPEGYVKLIADKIKKLGVPGVSIDFESEKLNSSYSSKLTNFMRLLREELPEGKYKISIAVLPRFEGSSENGFPNHGFYDYKELANYVDNVNIMDYDWHKTGLDPRPVLPEDMFKKNLEYTKANLPAEKAVILLPMYGYVWKTKNITKGKGKHKITHQIYIRQGTLSAKNTDRYIGRHGSVSDEIINGERRVQTKNSVAYVQDAEVLTRRVELLGQYGFNSVGGWRQSHGDKAIYDSLDNWKNN